ncbi:hypothetical protein C8Q72DRAFT_845211 [Fomitopsis betulina]|nr:hypothetical protein C8Q72DRAFT_845211 [Fomitopsis betulina]
MSDVYPNDPQAERYQVFLHNYLHLVGITIFYFDYALTFGVEYTRIWKQPATRSNYLFFLNRYLTLFGDVAVNVGNFYSFKTTQSCSQYAFYRQALLIVAQVLVCFILYLRTSALYNRGQPISGIILAIGLSLGGLAIFAVIGQHSTISLSGGCHTGISRATAVRLAVAWESLFVFDCMIFSLTMYKTWKHRQPLRNNRLDLITMMSRDGALYFAVMACANLSNTLTFYLLQPLLRGVLSTFASSVSVTMMSRLMLNLHEGAATHSTSANISSSENSTTLLFTSRIAMHESDMQIGRVLSDISVRETRYVEERTSGDETMDEEDAIELVDTRAPRAGASTAEHSASGP